MKFQQKININAGQYPHPGFFYDTAGKERKRHEGFTSKEDILVEFNKQGIRLKSDP